MTAPAAAAFRTERPERSDVELPRLATALASMDPSTIYSHRTAALLWGLWIPDFAALEVTSPATSRGSRYTTSVQRRTVMAHRRILAPGDVTERDGLPVTTVARTWVDLAAVLTLPDLVAAGDRALQVGATLAEIADRAASGHRVRGICRARTAAGLLNERSASRPESRIRCAIMLAGLPEPRVNEAICDPHGQWLAEPDLHYPEARLALEYNGAVHATPERMRKDATRLLDLQRAGWIVRTYTALDAFSRLDEVVTDVAGLLRQRAPRLVAEAHLARRVTYLQDQRRRISRL